MQKWRNRVWCLSSDGCKKIYCDLGQTKKSPYAKEQIKDIGHGRFVQAPKMGEIFIEAAWAHVLPGRTKNVPKTGPKRTRGDITVTPKNIFEIKNQKFAVVLILIPSGDSRNDKLATNGKERLIPPSQRSKIRGSIQTCCLK